MSNFTEPLDVKIREGEASNESEPEELPEN